MDHEATRVNHAVHSIKGFVVWAISKRRLSIIFLNVILAGSIVHSTFWLRDGFQIARLCVRFQCPPSITSARLPKNFSTKLKYVPNRHSGYSSSKNHLTKLFSKDPRKEVKNLFLVPSLSTYSTNSLGFRRHRPNSVESHELTSRANVLALGDSYTFGDEVDDLSTWPAYLERASGETVHNAGIGWFGSAQAVTRGYAISLTMRIDTAILSVFVDTDIKRDRWAGHNDRYRRRPVVDRDGVLMHLPAYDVRIKESGIIQAGVASKLSIMDYVLERLLQIPANKHVLLLQYGSNQVYPDPSKVALEERILWVKKAKSQNIPVVDTLAPLRKMKTSHRPLWIGNVFIPPRHFGHHTSYSNEIVAQAILDSGVLD